MSKESKTRATKDKQKTYKAKHAKVYHAQGANRFMSCLQDAPANQQLLVKSKKAVNMVKSDQEYVPSLKISLCFSFET